VQQQEGQLIEKWLKEDKLESTEELCDIVKPLDTRAALSIYVRGQSHQKVINSLVETGQTVQIVSYVKKVGFQADYPTMRRPWCPSTHKARPSSRRSCMGEAGP